ncbi:hypothetical protein FACS189427_00740 [Planctomycetales bacterium]|nr:hypothetical protein FACS189427_00740 [Planctomycetales bacterium]
MSSKELQDLLSRINQDDFVSSAHTSQHRMFGFITTNIRSIKTISQYILELLPEFIKRKDNLSSWEQWTTDDAVAEKNKQKFTRLEIAKILFRKVKDTPWLNNIGEKLYGISQNQNCGEKYLTLILSLYLLSGRYFGVDNQPLIEIEKILAISRDSIVARARDVLLNEEVNSLLLGSVFYNPASDTALDLAYQLLSDTAANPDIEYLKTLLANKTHFVNKKLRMPAA